jgi:glycosyltransferase involved in cell wall biosynthesis
MVTDAVEESSENRDYVGFAGRISKEKGIQVLIDASRRIPDIQFRAAGNFERLPNLPTQAPKNFKFLGHLSKESLDAFYASCRMFVLPSTWFEGFPIVLVETMLRGIPIVCSRIGGLQDIVDDGVSGLLFEPGNSEQLADKIKYLWDKPELCKKMGQEGRKKALREYTPDRYYKRIIEIYEQVIAASKRKNPTA